MSEALGVWVFDRGEQESQATTSAPVRTRRADLKAALLSKGADGAIEVEVVSGKLADVMALLWVDGLGWFEVVKVKKLQPHLGEREARLQLLLRKWPSA